MGLAAGIGAVLLGGFLQGRAQQRAYNEQARQQEQQAQLAYQNAEKLQKQGEEQAQNNAINEENKRRRMLALQGQNIASVGKSGVTMSGSAANAMADSAYNQEVELAIDRYNGRQKVDSIFQNSTDNVNQGDIYKTNASNYKKAGKAAMMNSMLQAGLQVATMGVGAKSANGAGAASSSSGGWNYSNFQAGTGGPGAWGKDYKSYTKGWTEFKW